MKFMPKLPLFGETIKYLTDICHVGIQVSYMAGKLLKRRIFWCKLFAVTSYNVGTGNFVDT